ncbi:MAG: threonylcarbamoyl-AMP synthase [Anaerolineae bacterium]|nr:threonylcarbamoyl-AMP synthase [Anaerolineae bacterium]
MSHVTPIRYPEAVEMAMSALQSGGLIVLPTDTVYGVASLLNEAAIDRIFAAKQRPPDKAVPVLLSDMDDVFRVARTFPKSARRLATAFWPGPLTLLLPKRDALPPNLSTLPTVGVRVPDHADTRRIIAAAGGALAVTSANRSDEPAACTVQAAISYLLDTVALYLDGGACPGGKPSTVVSLEGGAVRVLRAGPISEDALRRALAGRSG